MSRALPAHALVGGPEPENVKPCERCGAKYEPGLAAAACPGSLPDRIAAMLAEAEALALDLRAARQAATGEEKTALRFKCNALDDAVAALRKAVSK